MKQNFKTLKKYKQFYNKTILNQNLINFEFDNKPIIFLDLDETLIHCSMNKYNQSFETIYFLEKKIYIYFRPYLFKFLDNLYKKFNLIIFTASKKIYADMILKLIDPNDKYFKLKLYRENCIQIEKSVYIKNLKIIRNINLKNCFIIDNFAINFIFQLENGIPIIPFFGNNLDKELKYLLKYLNLLFNCEDILKTNNQKFKFNDYFLYENLDSLINNLLLI